MKHVIIGVGAAGIAAARIIRKQRGGDEIVMISTDNMVHSRCMLHNFIGGERSAASLSFVPQGFFADNKITWRAGITVTGIDTAAKRVNFDGGSESYDRLLIASGAKSFFPPIEGLREATGVYGLRDLPDAEAIIEKSAQARNIVVIGAGLVGMDAAYGLAEIGRKSIVVEIGQTILPVNLDAHAAAAYQAKFEAAGCGFRLGKKVKSVSRDSAGAVSALVLDDGEQLPCDLLIVAAGVKPAMDFLAGSGIAAERAVSVDRYMNAGKEGVYAAGDITAILQTWPIAVKQAETAALNMCGIPTEYDEIPLPKNAINFFGIPSLSAGQFNPQAGDVTNTREDRGRYQKVVLRGGIPVGVILQGDISRSGFWQHMITNKISVAGIRKPLWKVSFADSYGLDEKGEYKWVV